MKDQVTYQAVLFNMDKPDQPKFISIGKMIYDGLKGGWVNDMQLGPTVYKVDRCRAFDVVSEVFGTTYYLIIDVKKLIAAE